MKLIHQTTAFCRPSPGLQSFTFRIPGADAPGYYATAPERGLRIRLAYGSQGKRSLSVGLCSALKARAVSSARCNSPRGAAA